ncbi:hypothetical protein [Eubacterium sp.]|uniref:hypothetical protein n=1 Tax=Eubacterium sp. TaxID=142586 RepID=UPI0025E052AC|nr:hypothetical protein [Eubacterium sp.]MCR5628607.1 hypothetical protein [Eubacterium sp.]
MKFLNKLERKYGKYAIDNLTLILILGYVIGYVINLVNDRMFGYLTLNPYMIMKGQVWRLISWILVPPSELSLFTIVMLFFYYSIGRTLEQTWGKFKYNIFILCGILFTIASAFIALYVLPSSVYGMYNISEVNAGDTFQFVKGYIISFYVSTYYINLSIFLLFAALYPDMQVMLYFIIPIKIKWLAYLDVALMAYEVYKYGIVCGVIVFASLLNFLIFFALIMQAKGNTPVNAKRKHDYQKKVYSAKSVYEGGARHKCAICGRTELDNPNLTFRYCSKCTGSKEYCEDHLFTHEHK